MNPFHRHPILPRRAPLPPRSRTVLVLAALAHPALAADVNLTASNGIDTTSFNTNLSWSDGLAPAAGNAYFVPSGFNLRTPANSAADHAFAGDSLTLNGANLVYKGSTNVNRITVNNLTLNGALVNNASNSSTPFILDGTITVAGTGTTTLFANNAALTVDADIAGNSGTLLLQANSVSGRQVILAGASTYTGTISVTGSAGAVLAETGSLSFVVGANAVNNTVTGAVAVTFDGTFNFDLTNAGDTVGDQWPLVDANLIETYGPTFNIAGFTENNGFWTSADGRYQFNEATGVLSRISGDSDGDGLPDTWENLHFGNLDWGALDDPDGDYATNLLEFQSTTDPDDDSSWPDTDADTLNDGWERAFFTNSLAQGPDDDPDNDHNTNFEEYLAMTDPTTAFSYPDSDEDGLNDGWERFHFPEAANVAVVSATADPDGDLFTNSEEFSAGTDPNDQVSSPDTDNDGAGDGLPDGWEVKYFRVGAETLAEAIARQDGTGDPDGDSIGNSLEYAAGTDPTDAESVETALGYWRFEEATAGEVPAGGNGEYLFPTSIQDSSLYGNHMMAWATYSRPNYDVAVPLATVPATGAGDAASLYFLRNNSGQYFIESVFSTPTDRLGGGTAILKTHAFEEFTVEASFKTDLAPAADQHQTMVAKLGNVLNNYPPFWIKVDPENKLEVILVDGSGTLRDIGGTTVVAANSWYSVAVTATATELTLWLKKPGDAGYVLEASAAISGAWYAPSGVVPDTAWNIGGGMWQGSNADGFQGNIDEVRISAVALPETEFLFHEDATAFQLWAAANIPDVNQRGETQDPDGDGTSNLAEFTLGLNPVSGTSFFTGKLTGATITWPAANGIQFTVQRSTTLGTWDDVATVTATGATGTWTDPAPPTGKAFYRVIFTE